MSRYLTFILVVLTSCCLPEFNSGSFRTVTIMSWNLQNLFDAEDNGTEYSEFSVSQGNWNEDLYHKRLKSLSRIIKLNNPDIIGFQEIEGVAVLKDLVSEYLSEYKYFVATNTTSPIEVGFLSKYPITNVSEISPGKDYGLRNILEITIDVDGNSLKLINNHWKSKLGSFSENLRIKSSLVLQNRLNELKNDEVIILGDFNENYNESTKVSYTTAITLKNKGDGLRISGSKDLGENEYYTPWPYSGFEGSYLYKDNWETIDNFFLNRNLFDDSKFSYSSFRVDNRDLLFDSGSNICKWRNDLEFGYSDHLPIILEIVINKIETTLE